MIGEPETLSANVLRRQTSARNLQRDSTPSYETTFGSSPNVIYRAEVDGSHGNFLTSSYKRICANEAWRRRLEKSYTSASRVPRRWDRKRGELECANSSDALLMNVFCYPGVLRRPQLRALLAVESNATPQFGVRAMLPMRSGEIDRTEIDMQLGHLLVEAKFTEAGFGSATEDRLLRYVGVPEVFDVAELPWSGSKVLGYQLIRGVLAAQSGPMRFLVLCDRRRADLLEVWFRVLRAVHNSELRSRMALLHWQELAAAMPPKVQGFLAEKYGICP